MEVLVLGDALHDPVGHRVTAVTAGVAVADARGELLEGDVGHAAEGVLAVLVVAHLHVGHAAVLDLDRVLVAGDDQVVAQDDGVTALLGGPAVHPRHPRGVLLAEHVVDLAVVGGQVVLRHEVDVERRPRDP